MYKKILFAAEALFCFALMLGACVILGIAFPKGSDAPAWVQAIGSIVAILAAVWLSNRQHEQSLDVARTNTIAKQMILLRAFIVITKEARRYLKFLERDWNSSEDAENMIDLIASAKSWGNQTLETINAIPIIEMPYPELIQDVGFLRHVVYAVAYPREHGGVSNHIIELYGKEAFEVFFKSLDNTESNFNNAIAALTLNMPFTRTKAIELDDDL